MKPISLSVFACAAALFISGAARADTIFEVEHARASARAGVADADDEEFLQRWGGAPNGYYQAPRDDYVDGPYYRRAPVKRHRWNQRPR